MVLRIKTGLSETPETLEEKLTLMALNVRSTGERLAFDAPEYKVMTIEAFRNELSYLKEQIEDFLVEIEDEE